MELLVLSATADGAPTGEVDFTVTIDGGSPQTVGPFSLGFTSLPAAIQLPPGTNVVRVTATPRTAEHWPVTGAYQLQGPAQLVPFDTPDEFAPPIGAGLFGINGTAVAVHLSRLRRASRQALSALGGPSPHLDEAPTVWPPPPSPASSPWPPEEWDAAPLVRSVIGIPAVLGSTIVAELETIEPAGRSVVLERRGGAVPALYAVFWPQAIPVLSSSPATPFLVYFHANMGQSFPTYYSGPYPWDFDFVFHGLWHYMNAQEDMLRLPSSWLGLPYQVTASDRAAVLVLPLSHPQQEIGAFRHADQVVTTLLEIDRFMFREGGVYDRPAALGRCSLGAFSAATGQQSAFLTANASHSFVTDTVREVYAFDPPDGIVASVVGGLLGWATGQPGQRHARLYRQGAHPSLLGVLPGSSMPSGPFDVASPDGTLSATVTPAATWKQVAQRVWGPATAFGAPDQNLFFQTHHTIAGLMLTDALRRGAYPDVS